MYLLFLRMNLQERLVETKSNEVYHDSEAQLWQDSKEIKSRSPSSYINPAIIQNNMNPQQHLSQEKLWMPMHPATNKSQNYYLDKSWETHPEISEHQRDFVRK